MVRAAAAFRLVPTVSQWRTSGQGSLRWFGLLADAACLPGAHRRPATTGSAGGRHVVLRDEDDPVAEATAGEVPLSVGDVLERHLLDW